MFCPFHFKSFQVIFATFLDTLPPVVRKLVNNNFDPSHQQPQPGLGWDIHGKPNFTRRCESAENPLTVQDTEVQSWLGPVTVIVSRKLVIITTLCTVTVGCCCSAVKEDPNIIHQLLSTTLSILSILTIDSILSIHHTIHSSRHYEPVLCGAAAV